MPGGVGSGDYRRPIDRAEPPGTLPDSREAPIDLPASPCKPTLTGPSTAIDWRRCGSPEGLIA
jgi:hypothetical protein